MKDTVWSLESGIWWLLVPNTAFPVTTAVTSPPRFSRAVPRLGEVVLPGNLFEMHVLMPHLALQQLASWGWAQ